MKYLFILLAAFSLSACSYSPEQLRIAYNGMGKDYAKDLKQMADFNAEQRSQLDQFGQHAQQWHRQQRLPNYAAIITRVGTQLKQNGDVAQQDLHQFLDLMNGYPHLNEATSLNYQLGKLAQELNNTQLEQIIKNLQDEQHSEKTAIRAQTPEIRQRQLVKMVDGMTEYLGVELQKSQLDILREFAPNFHGLGEAHIAGQARWQAQLENLLKQRKQADFPQRFAKHMQQDNDHYLLSQQEPQLVKANRAHGILMIKALNASLDNNQRKTLADALISIGTTFAEMAQ